MAYSIRGSGLITLGAAVLMTVLCALVLTERSRPAYAQLPRRVNATTLSGITRSELLRVCLGSEAQAGWRPLLQFATSDKNVGALTKELPVAGRFGCVDTTPDELALAGFEVEPTGRVQFQLRIEKLPEDAHGSVEIVDALTGETKVHQAAIALPAFISHGAHPVQ
jgi:hypothetical protein